MKAPAGFEKSRFDRDPPGTKEGSPADQKRDAKAMPKYVAAKKQAKLAKTVERRVAARNDKR